MQPRFSIIIPTRNRRATLDACLRALAAQDTSRANFEVIVVDDGSVPPVTITRTAPWRDALDLTIVHQPPSGPAAARNHGARLARGAWLAFTDDDCQPAHDWLGILTSAAAVYPTHALGGRTINALPDNHYAAASQLVVDHLLPASHGEPARARFLASNNLAVPAALFRQIGGFDADFRAAGGEDRAFCDDWRAHSYSLIYLPAAVVWHAHALTLRTFWQQHVAYGGGAFRYHTRSAATSRLEPAQFYTNLLAAPFTQHLPHPITHSCLLLLAQAATAAGYVHAAAGNWRANVR